MVSTDAGGKGVVPGTVAELAAGLASDLPADFEFGLDELRVGLELAPRLGAVLELDLESMFVSGLETDPAPDSMPDFAQVFASVCSGAALDMDEASVALKLGGADDGGLAAAEAVCAAAGMRIASTYIGAPRVRLHSMRQWRAV